MGECQDFVFPRILLYARLASVTYELDPTTSDSCPAMLWPPLRVRFLYGTRYFNRPVGGDRRTRRIWCRWDLVRSRQHNLHFSLGEVSAGEDGHAAIMANRNEFGRRHGKAADDLGSEDTDTRERGSDAVLGNSTGVKSSYS